MVLSQRVIKEAHALQHQGQTVLHQVQPGKVDSRVKASVDESLDLQVVTQASAGLLDAAELQCEAAKVPPPLPVSFTGETN